ncbi:Uncharacterized protein Adt_28520 [Abeliophyllum distichum]|uniref:Transposase (putative) gypsy type domain-containing protein n=1 Tax=Abeliophyllum distichum TaxID=126358 RepID=A0ABD1RZ10_9LAMI
MSSSSTRGDATRRVGGETSPPVSLCMEGVLPIRGVDGRTGEAIPTDLTPSLRGGDDPYWADVVRWAAMDVPSIMVEEDLTKLRKAYRIPDDIELIFPGPNEQACFPKRGCTALYLNVFVSGMRLPLHPMLRRILRAYDLAPTQVAPNGWSQMVGGMYLWFQHSFGMEMPPHVFQTIYQPRKLPRKKGRDKVVGWYYFCPLGSHKPLVTGCPSSIKQWKESWFWVSVNWQRVFDDPELDLDVLSVYGICNPLQRTLAVHTSGDVVLEGPSRVTPTPESGDGRPFDSKRRLRELIGAPGARIPDDVLRNLPFYPSMGAQAMKKYFTPKWEEFSAHGELEDVLETSLASAIRASAMHLKEHKQALEGLQAALKSARTAYDQMEADLKKSDSNVLNLTKQLDNANAAQKVTAEALEATNGEKRHLLEEAKLRDDEIQSLRRDLEPSENGRKEAEAGRNEVEEKLATAEAEFMANFHNTEAYTNFSDYFARIGQQEVLTALRNDHPDFDIKPLEARFPPLDVEGEEEN